jgi:hypothetical protein
MESKSEQKSGGNSMAAKIKKQGKKISILESGTGGLVVNGASSCEILNAAAGLKLIDMALARRQVAKTEMNRHSSRGHCVVLITIIKRNLSTSTSTIGQLYSVDLAGSESVGKTKVGGHQLAEAGSINKSLLNLGRVIKALVDNENGKSERKNESKSESKGAKNSKKNSKKKSKKNKVRVPYRDSNLTRLLQHSLGGTARAALVVNVSPARWNMQETISTLRFGASTSKIINQPKAHEVTGLGGLQKLLKQCKNKVRENRTELNKLEDEMSTYHDFFSLIRSVAPLLKYDAMVGRAGGDAEDVSLLVHERRVDVKNMRIKVVGSKEEEEKEEEGEEKADSSSSGGATTDEEQEYSTAGFRQSSRDLSTMLRTSSYVEKEEIVEVKMAVRGLLAVGACEKNKAGTRTNEREKEHQQFSKSLEEEEEESDRRI